jgi:hypothetical protein
MKKLVGVLAVVFVIFAGSCTQSTCPTYTKGIKEVPQEQEVEKKAQQEKV